MEFGVNWVLQALSKWSRCNSALDSSCQMGLKVSGARTSGFHQERLKIDIFIVINQFGNDGLNLFLKACVGQTKDPPSTHTHTHLHSHIWVTYIYTHTYITYILWGQGTEAHSGWLHIGCKCWVYICSNIVKVEFHRGKWGNKEFK